MCNSNGLDFLRLSVIQEKETLVSMFLANASITQLAGQYNVISELSSKISLLQSDPD